MHEELTPEYLQALQGMSGATKLGSAFRLYWSARKLKASFLDRTQPAWTRERIEAEVKQIFPDATE